jgi:hypothetical protein
VVKHKFCPQRQQFIGIDAIRTGELFLGQLLDGFFGEPLIALIMLSAKRYIKRT